jgi:hypothetical protein
MDAMLSFQVSTLPPCEQYSDEYKVWCMQNPLFLILFGFFQLDIITAKIQQLNSCGLPPMPAQQWDGLEELGSIYSATFPEPAVRILETLTQ